MFGKIHSFAYVNHLLDTSLDMCVIFSMCILHHIFWLFLSFVLLVDILQQLLSRLFSISFLHMQI